MACVQICLSVEQNIGTVITSIPTLGDPFLVFLNHTRTSFLGKYLWPNPPLPSCWGNSQTDDIHLQNPPDFPDFQFDPECGAANENAEFWRAVDLQMGGLSFDACARPQKAYSPSNQRSQTSGNPRSWGNRRTTRWGSRSKGPKPHKPKSTSPKGTPPERTTPKRTSPKSTTPTTTPPDSNTPRPSKPNSRMHSRRPSRDRSPGSRDRRSLRSRISRPSSWIRWSWRTGDDEGYQP